MYPIDDYSFASYVEPAHEDGDETFVSIESVAVFIDSHMLKPHNRLQSLLCGLFRSELQKAVEHILQNPGADIFANPDFHNSNNTHTLAYENQ